MSQAQIILPEGGFHNADLARAQARLLQGQSYRNLSTICLIPTLGMISARVLQSWFSLMVPMNQKFTRIFLTGMEVGDAYSQAVDFILGHSELSTWKYILTLEDDNLPPPDGLLKLYESIGDYDAVGGLYWTKGPGGQPMIYGDPAVLPRNFIPQVPQIDALQRANGLGMGFNLFKVSMFRNPKLPRPFFKTRQDFTPGVGAAAYTQDLYFYEQAGSLGYKFACDTRVKVGHYDKETDLVW